MIVAKVKGAQRLTAVCALAAARGLRPGQALADARALCPAVRVVEADAGADAALMAAVIDWCRRFTPLSAPDGPDGAMLDVGGSAHLFGGETGLVEAVESGLRRQGLACRAAVASTPEAAWALARFGTETIAPAPHEPGFEPLAAALPLAALRIAPEVVAGLGRAGLARVGDLLHRPRAPIAARFGAEVLQRLDGLMGRSLSPIGPRFEAPRCVAERRFAAGLTRAEGIEAALLPLCRHLCAALARRGEGARTVAASFFRVDGAVKHLRLGTSRPTRDPEALFALFREKIAALGEDGLDTGYGFDLIRLAVAEGEKLDARQDGLDPEDAGSADSFADLADRLGARLGLRRVLRLAARDSHLPECAVVALPMAAPDPGPGGDGAGLCRPIRLFERPEPIDTVASVPDGPPVRFRWRQVMHDVAAIEGPERIAPQWWTGEAELTRDYFRAEDRHGRRYWLYREGLFGREVDRPRWFLHGLFG
ncbi:Y-family DNA polymerase [Lichenibacterium dinghuense]|uniref:Y-family DNA polymerase n=1 Tax=Lichenibacterium dinghuense TaxID=2895977 RepID=UPI002815CAFE|nr:DNA polymerase Y family protein [Lichenibacterium sp. 6Y81]